MSTSAPARRGLGALLVGDERLLFLAASRRTACRSDDQRHVPEFIDAGEQICWGRMQATMHAAAHPAFFQAASAARYCLVDSEEAFATSRGQQTPWTRSWH